MITFEKINLSLIIYCSKKITLYKKEYSEGFIFFDKTLLILLILLEPVYF
jgi:hypothetical protein